MKKLLLFLLLFAFTVQAQTWYKYNGLFNQKVYSTTGGRVGTDDGIFIRAANDVWERGGLEGRIVYDLFENGTMILAGTDDGNFYSTDGGYNWSQSSLGFAFYNYIPTGDGLFAASGGGILHSTDGGASWSVFAEPIHAGIIDAKPLNGTGNWVAVTVGGRCVHTTDGGENWKITYTGDITGIHLQRYYAGEQTFMMTTRQNGCFFIEGADLYDSTKTWEQRNTGLGNLYVNSYSSYNEIIKVGTDSGIYYTTDKGASWNAGGLPGLKITDLYPYAAATETGGVYTCPNELGSATYTQVGYSNITALKGTSNNTLYIGTRGYGMYKYYNSMLTQINSGLGNLNINDITVDVDGYLFAATDEGVYKSTDDGTNWESVLPNTGKIYSLITSARGSSLETFAGGDESFYLVESNNNWNGGTDNLSGEVYDIAYHPGMNKYIAVCDGGIFTSAIDYIAWTKITYFRGRAITIGTNGDIYIGVNNGAIQKSSDNGVNWVSSGWLASYIKDMATDSQGFIYAAHNFGLSRSTDNGATWTEANDGITPTSSHKIALCFGGTPDGNLYVGTLGLGLYSTDATISDVKDELTPVKFSLAQNYPNPFNPVTTIGFSLPAKEGVTIKVFDILGREVTTLVNKELNAGYHEVKFNASNLASGIYIYRIQAGKFSSAKKLVLLK